MLRFAALAQFPLDRIDLFRGDREDGLHLEPEITGIVHEPSMDQRVAANDCIRPTEERGVPAILGLLDRTVEERRLTAERIARRYIREPLWRLHECHLGVLEV